MIRSILIYIVNNPVLFFGLFFLFRACLWAVMENLWRARSVPYRQVAIKDFAAETFHVFVVVPVALHLYYRLIGDHPFPQMIQQMIQNIPMPLRIVLFLLIGDFGYYWSHRLMHTRALWRTHKWHHSPTYLYCLAGCRAAIQQQFLVLLPYLLLGPMLASSPWWVYTALLIFSYLTVDLMHLNVSWRQGGWNGSLLCRDTTIFTTAPIRTITI